MVWDKSLSCLTEYGHWELRIDFQFENKTWFHLYHKQFKAIGGFNRTTTDPFVTHLLNNIRFSIGDNNNDKHSGDNCVTSHT